MKIKDKFILKEGSGKIYFMSDLHYGHNNVIKYDDRGFDTVENMNSYIVSELNKLNPNDIVFDLGDMFWNTPLNAPDAHKNHPESQSIAPSDNFFLL